MSRKERFEYGDSFFEEVDTKDYGHGKKDRRNSQSDKRRESKSERFLYIQKASQVSESKEDNEENFEMSV